jgi:transcriptional regulator GlxA family with amidase domain
MPGARMDRNAFRVYTVAETAKPIPASGGMKFIPDYRLENAPAPKVIVIPAQSDPSEAMLEWIRKSSKTADLTMSVCTGSYVLAKTGLLAGKAAITHHGAYIDFAMKFPDIHVRRGVRFVEDGNLASSGGLTCGMDLALRVVERLSRPRGGPANSLQYGISGRTLDAPGVERGLCQGADLRE